MRQSLSISLFSFVLSFCIAILYWGLRIGFLDNSFSEIIKVLGVSAFILILPTGFSLIRNSFFRGTAKIFFTETIIPVYGLTLIGIAGYITPIINLNISIVFIITGYLLLAIALKQVLKEADTSNKMLLIVVAGIFALWVGPVCWVFGYLKPYIIEGWAIVGTDRSDTPFHLAIAQMIKTYGVPTTGLDGIPYMNYHWGSHWFFAQLSKLLNIPVIVVYQLCYPVIIAPILFRSFLSFVMELKEHYRLENAMNKKLNLFFWVVFIAIFAGIFKSYWAGNAWAEHTGTGTGSTAFMLTSESYAFSIFLMFGVLSIVLNFWLHKDSATPYQKYVLLIILLPLLMIMVGLVKISTLYMLACLLGYLFLRLKMFKNLLLTTSMFAITTATLWVAALVYEPRENHGNISMFFFFNTRDVSLPLFGILFYIWTYIFIIVYIVKEKLYQSTFSEVTLSLKSLPIECVLWVSFVGFLPGMFLRIQNYDALYFTEIQIFISGALILAYIPFYKMAHQYSKSKRWAVGIASIIIILVFLINTNAYLTHVIGDSINHHASILSKSTNKKLRVRDIMRIYAINTPKIKEAYSKNKAIVFFKKLQELDKLPPSEKRNSLIYVDFRTLLQKKDYNWKLYCSNIPFIVPGLTGIAMIDGIDVTYFEMCGSCCENDGFSYAYYPKWKTRAQIAKPFNVEDLCRRTKEKGFTQLIFFNLKNETFEKVSCR